MAAVIITIIKCANFVKFKSSAVPYVLLIPWWASASLVIICLFSLKINSTFFSNCYKLITSNIYFCQTYAEAMLSSNINIIIDFPPDAGVFQVCCNVLEREGDLLEIQMLQKAIKRQEWEWSQNSLIVFFIPILGARDEIQNCSDDKTRRFTLKCQRKKGKIFQSCSNFRRGKDEMWYFSGDKTKNVKVFEKIFQLKCSSTIWRW